MKHTQLVIFKRIYLKGFNNGDLEFKEGHHFISQFIPVDRGSEYLRRLIP